MAITVLDALKGRCSGKVCYGILLSGLLLSGSLQAALPEPVKRFLQQGNPMQMGYQQQITGTDGRRLASSSGSLMVQRPGRFIWDIRTPDVQRYSSDGKALWIYDEALAQLIVRGMDELPANTPAALLNMSDTALAAAFRFVAEPGSDPAVLRYRLVPLQDTGTQSMLIQLTPEGRLLALISHDALNNRVQFIFQPPEFPQSLPDDAFRITPGPDVDILDERPQS